MKGCKTHTHYTEVDFLLQFVLGDYAGFFKSQISKESLKILSPDLFHAFTKLKQYEQLPENKYEQIPASTCIVNLMPKPIWFFLIGTT